MRGSYPGETSSSDDKIEIKERAKDEELGLGGEQDLDKQILALNDELAIAKSEQKQLRDDFNNVTAWSWLKYLVSPHPGKPNKAELMAIWASRASLSVACCNLAGVIGYLWPAINMGQVQDIDSQSQNTTYVQHLTDQSNTAYYSANTVYYMATTIASSISYVVSIRSTYVAMKERMLGDAAKRVTMAEEKLAERQRIALLLKRIESAEITQIQRLDTAAQGLDTNIDAAARAQGREVDSAKQEIVRTVQKTADNLEQQNTVLTKQVLELKMALAAEQEKNNRLMAELFQKVLHKLDESAAKSSVVAEQLTKLNERVENLDKKNV